MRITQLDEALAGIGVRDSRVGKKLHAQGQLILAVISGLTPECDVRSKIKFLTELLVIGPIQRHAIVSADTEVCEPVVRALRGLQPDHGSNAHLGGPRWARDALPMRGPSADGRIRLRVTLTVPTGDT
jgi:hypothetical protein